MNYNQGPVEELKNFFRKRSVLSSLILINLIIWLIIKVLFVVFSLYRTPEEYTGIILLRNFAVPAWLPALMARPWTLVTYMFLHFDFFHILFNMIWLYWFGKIFLMYLSQKKLLITYILGGISGGLLYIFFYNFFPVFEDSLRKSMALGASASVMAIVMGISFYVPNHTFNVIFLGSVRIIYLAVILFVLDFFEISGTNSGGHIAHIGGALFGVLYVTILKNVNGKPRSGFADSFSTYFRNKKMKATYNNGTRRPVSDEDYNVSKMERQQRIDNILEKISRGGYDSLTKEEKDYLFKASGKKN